MKRIIGILTVCFCLFIINGQVVSASINNVNLNCILGTKTNGIYKSFLEDYEREVKNEKEWRKN